MTAEPIDDPQPVPGWRSELGLTDPGLVSRVLRLDLLVTRVLDAITAEVGLTAADHHVLGVVRLSPDQRSSPGRLSELLGRSTGGMSLTLDRLEAAGWLVREPDPDDRRRVTISLTPSGLEASTRANKALHAWEDGLGVDAVQRAAIADQLDELIALVETVEASS